MRGFAGSTFQDIMPLARVPSPATGNSRRETHRTDRRLPFARRSGGLSVAMRQVLTKERMPERFARVWISNLS